MSTINIVQSNVSTTSSGGTGYTGNGLPAATTAGNGFAAICFTHCNAGAPTITGTDSYNNTYSPVVTNITDGYNLYLNVFASPGGTSGAAHGFTTASNLAINSSTTFFMEINSMLVSGFIDSAAINSSRGFLSPPYLTGNANPAAVPAAGELLISVCSSNYFEGNVPFADNQTGGTGGFVIQQTQPVGNNNQPSAAFASQVISANGTYRDAYTDGTTGAGVICAIFGLIGASAIPYGPMPFIYHRQNRLFFI